MGSNFWPHDTACRLVGEENYTWIVAACTYETKFECAVDNSSEDNVSWRTGPEKAFADHAYSSLSETQMRYVVDCCVPPQICYQYDRTILVHVREYWQMSGTIDPIFDCLGMTRWGGPRINTKVGRHRHRHQLETMELTVTQSGNTRCEKPPSVLSWYPSLTCIMAL